MAGDMTLGITIHGTIAHGTTDLGDGAAFTQAGTLRGHIADIGVHIFGDTTEDFMEDITEAFTVDITADTTQVIGQVVLTADLITVTNTDVRRIRARETVMQAITGHRARARQFPTEALRPVQVQAEARLFAQVLQTGVRQPAQVRTELFAVTAMQDAALQ